MSALLDYDTGPLNWVRGDIDAALQAALGRIQAYSVDVDLTNALRLARDDAHQVDRRVAHGWPGRRRHPGGRA